MFIFFFLKLVFGKRSVSQYNSSDRYLLLIFKLNANSANKFGAVLANLNEISQLFLNID